MNCDEVRERLTEHLLGPLEEPLGADVRRHLRGCAGCRHEMAVLEEGMSTFALATHAADPPAELRGRVLAVLEQEWSDVAPVRGLRAPRPARVARAQRRPASWMALAAAAVVVVAALAWGGISTVRASHFEAAANRYDAFLGALGGENVRVGTLRGTGLEGSAVLYDSKVGQSWALVLVRAPGLSGEVDVALSSSSGSRTMAIRSLYFGQGGEASTWLVTASSLKPFDRVTLTDPTTGALLATASVS